MAGQDIIYITNMDSNESGMLGSQKALKAKGIDIANIQVVKAGDMTELTTVFKKRLDRAAFVFVAWMGTNRCCDFVTALTDYLIAGTVSYYFDFTDKSCDREARAISEEEERAIKAYFVAGGLANYQQFCLWLENRFCGFDYEDVAPISMPWSGIHYEGEPIYTSYEEYAAKHINPQWPTLGFIYTRLDWLWGHNDLANALQEYGRRHECNVICVFSSTSYDEAADAVNLRDSLHKYFLPQGLPVIQVLLNSFHFAVTNRDYASFEDFKALNVPILQTYNIYNDYERWEQDPAGLTATEVAYAVAMPEFDGIIHGGLATCKATDEEGVVFMQPVPERVDMLIRKAKKWALLKRLPNKDKRIAIIFHNHPPTNANIGVAVALDSIESVRRLLLDMQAAGYVVDHIPATAQELAEELTDHVTNDRRYLSEKLLDSADGKLSNELYSKYCDSLPEKARRQMLEHWGEAPGDIFIHQDKMIVPGIMNGNIFLTVEPPRGFGENPDKIYHSPDMPPTHQYLGYYYWLRAVWQAHAIVFMGTHGSLEWLPGKGTAMSNACYPDICLGDLPDVYPYWITNMGEGTQAKRRAAACLIDYMSAPMSTAGLYDELEELEKLLNEYAHFKLVEETQARMSTVQEMIREQAAKCDMEAQEQDSFDDYVADLHNCITDIKNMQISTGLHILGDVPTGEVFREYLMLLTRVENGSVPSLSKTLAEHHGYEYYELLENSAKFTQDGKGTYGQLLDTVHEEARQIIALLEEFGYSKEQARLVLELPFLAGASEECRAKLLQVSEYICTQIAPGLLQTVQEKTNYLRALEGAYIEVGSAGAPTSGGADLLPTGRNFYSIDPRKLPTTVAWNIGKGMADSIIERYVLEEGRYPESVGIILWATNNMRNHGECISEFLYLLGLRPVWQAGSGIIIDSEVIPLEELQRPRIDVTGRISGLFRDSLPGSVDWLDGAVQKVAALDEPLEMNYVRKHVLEDSAELESSGLSKEEAWREATYRIFGDAPGAYGAGIDALLESKNWESVDDMAEVYTRWGAHAYGNGTQGSYLPVRFKKRMSQIDITVFNMDNRESSLLSGDDYNSYRGGMVAAVRSIKGVMPKNYISDSSDRNSVKLRTLKEELTRWFRGEAINPKYIEGMKQHGYKGAGDLAGYVAVSYQWDATSETMDDWMYEKYAEKYALDPAMQQWFKEVNPWALQRITEVLLEAEQRQLWQAKPETKIALQQLYLDMEGELEECSDK